MTKLSIELLDKAFDAMLKSNNTFPTEVHRACVPEWILKLADDYYATDSERQKDHGNHDQAVREGESQRSLLCDDRGREAEGSRRKD